MSARRQPLVDHALESLRIATALPGGVGGDPAVLRARCEAALSEFAALATRAGHEAEGIEAARFALVALIDERAMAPGSPVRGEWLDRPLQLTLFECCSGGEEFYRRLERWRRPRRPQDADVLEVFQTCLALGFRGRMAGEAQTAARRQLAEQTAAEVLEQRTLPQDGLSPAWRPAPSTATSQPQRRRVWLIPVVACAALLVVWLASHAVVAAAGSRLVAELR
jgi:type IV/VI secretion system ImpK/VasF family protein